MITIDHQAKHYKPKNKSLTKVKRKKLFKGKFKYYVIFKFKWNSLISKKYDIRYNTRSLIPYRSNNVKKRFLKFKYKPVFVIRNKTLFIYVEDIENFLNQTCFGRFCIFIDWKKSFPLKVYFEEKEDIVLLHMYLHEYIYAMYELEVD